MTTSRRIPRLLFQALAGVLLAGAAQAALIAHWDPNLTSTMYQDGGGSGGTVPVTNPYVGQPAQWISDTVASYDVQQAGAGTTVAAGPAAGSPYVLRFPGTVNGLLGFGFAVGSITPITTAMDTDQQQILMALKVDALASGTRGILGLNYASTDDYESLSYDHANNLLQYKVNAATATVAVPENEWFLAKLVWNSGTGISLTVFKADGSNLAATAAGTTLAGADLNRYRWGGSENGTFFQGCVGDVYFLSTATDDTTALVTQLRNDYALPEPCTAALLAVAGLATLRRRRR